MVFFADHLQAKKTRTKKVWKCRTHIDFSPLTGFFFNISLIVTVEGMMTIFRNYQDISALLGEYSQQVSLFHLSLPQVRLPVDSPRTLRRVS